MVVNKRKKVTRQRGSHTHGWGSKKKHRGSGNRGGHGFSGTGKRADQVKPSIWKLEYFGKHGFHSRKAKEQKAVNVQHLEENYDRLKQQGKIKAENGFSAINIGELGFTKLLGKGKAARKWKITAQQASLKAVEAVKQTGGEVITKQG